MKKLTFIVTLIAAFMLSSFGNACFAQSSSTVTDSLAMMTANSQFSMEDIITLCVGVIVILAILFILGHMIYVRYIKKPYNTFDVSYFKEVRAMKSGALPTYSESEANALGGEIDEAISLFSIEDSYDSGETFMCIGKNKDMKKALATYKKAVSYAPTDEAVVDKLNHLADLINENNVRHHFHGSKALIWVSGIIGLLIGIMMICSEEVGAGIGAILFFGVSVFLYIIACQGPAWLMAKKLRKGSGHASNSMIAGVFGMIAGAKTVRTTTKWSDGSTTVEDDHSQHWIALVLGIMIFVTMAVFLFVFTLWNYLRNYVFYF